MRTQPIWLIGRYKCSCPEVPLHNQRKLARLCKETCALPALHRLNPNKKPADIKSSQNATLLTGQHGLRADKRPRSQSGSCAMSQPMQTSSKRTIMCATQSDLTAHHQCPVTSSQPGCRCMGAISHSPRHTRDLQ